MRNLDTTLKLIDSFAAEQGITIVPSPGSGKGFWSGASFITVTDSGDMFLYYRLRHPREFPHDKNRGFRCFIGKSDDGIRFTTLWSANKKDFAARSLEKGCLAKRPDGTWLFWVCYDAENSQQWQIDVMESTDPESFDPSTRRIFLSPADVNAHDIKDPHVFPYENTYAIFANNTVEAGPREETLVALSKDGMTPSRVKKNILTPTGDKNAWDAYSSRLTGILPLSDGFLMFYDGQCFGGEICEEDCGLCFAQDLLGPYRRLTDAGPFRKGVRYLQGLWFKDALMLYYEFTLPDGSHELRLFKLD